MKAILAAVFAVLIGLAFSTTTFAQATPETPKAPMGSEMKKEEGKKVEKKEMKKEKKAKKAKKEMKKEEMKEKK